MPRPREFDVDDLLEKAMLAFLERGMDRTSMRHLEAVTGVKQVSLYNAFGNKEGLFLAAFDRYTNIAREIQAGFLDSHGFNGIAAYVNAIVSTESPMPQPHSGCMIVNTALLAETASTVVKMRVIEFRAGMQARFLATLESARDDGQLNQDLNLDQCAEFIVSVVWGIYVSIRLAGNDPSIGQSSARVLEATVRAWCAPNAVSA